MQLKTPLAAALFAVVALGACQRDGAGDAAARDTVPTAEGADPTGTASVHVDMGAQNNSNVTGMAMLDHTAETVNASLSLTGLRQGQRYSLHLSPGRCGETGERHTVKTFELQGGEQREQAISIEKREFDPAQRNYVLEVRDAANTVVSCGEIPEHAHRTQAAGAAGN